MESIKKTKSKTVKGIQKILSGNYASSYRVRKTILGKKFDCTFTELKDAEAYLNTLNSF